MILRSGKKMKLTKEEFAARITGRFYTEELFKEDIEILKESNLVCVHGASDDLMEVAGMIMDEIDCYEGGTFKLDKDGFLTNKCDERDCPYFEKVLENAKYSIEAVWQNEDPTWSYITNIPHATFDILEDNDIYCRGIVFSMEDLV
jgi:hypothetical protein